MTADAQPAASWQHQIEAYNFVEKLWRSLRLGAMLAMCMGAGKTKVAIDLACGFEIPLLLILCPLRVVEVWRTQFARFVSLPYEFLALDDHAGSVQDKTRRAREMVEWAAAHHKRLVIAINYESARSEPFATWALSRVWPMVIADESHRLKDPGGRTSRWAARLGLQTRYRLALTGTPMAHEPLDIWGQFRFLDPSILDRTYGSFKLRHAVMGGYYGKEIVAWKDLDELNQKFYSIAYRVTDEVLDLPAELDQTLSTELAPGVAKIYRDMERDLVAWIAEGVAVTAANALVRLLRLQQITGGTLTTEEGDPYHIDCAKEDLLADFLSDVGDEPVVVFARFTSDLAAIRHACEREKLLCGELSGHSGDRDLLAWQRGSKYDPTVLAVQIQTGSSGISLTRARIAIYYSIGYSLTDYLQSRARIRRPPQNRPCVYYHLVIQNSIDEIVLRAVRARHNLIESALEELKK